jgi:hypothetical protein
MGRQIFYVKENLLQKFHHLQLIAAHLQQFHPLVSPFGPTPFLPPFFHMRPKKIPTLPIQS